MAGQLGRHRQHRGPITVAAIALLTIAGFAATAPSAAAAAAGNGAALAQAAVTATDNTPPTAVSPTPPPAGVTVTAAPTTPATPGPHPFGDLSCTAEHGIRFCPGGLQPAAATQPTIAQPGTTQPTTAQQATTQPARDLRVPSFDGAPLDADVALPPAGAGNGPFPLIVLLHGLGGSKAEFENTTDDGGLDDVTLAHDGWAVLMYTARGFGNSCGTAASRAHTPACTTGQGWIHLADQRYEVRDTEQLAGDLVDEGIARPTFAVAGVSYGAGQSLELAALKNRERLPDGRFVKLTSPRRHIPMRVGAAFAIWPWDDLATALVPNGRLAVNDASPAVTDRIPPGIEKQSWVDLLYGVTTEGYLAPPGTDPSADLTTWQHELSAGEPYGAADLAALKQIQTYHSAIGIPEATGGPAPTAIQSGWTDTLFPVSEALHYAATSGAAHNSKPLLLMLADVGHGWAQGKQADTARTTTEGIDFLNALLLHDDPTAPGHTNRPPPTGVLALPTTCPSTAPSTPVRQGRSLAALQHGSLVVAGTATQSRTQVVTSGGGSPATATALDPAYDGQPLCHALPAAHEPGTASYTRAVGRRATVLLGTPAVSLRLSVTGRYPELVGRLWDVSPAGTTRQLVSIGVVRPSINQSARTSPHSIAHEQLTFQLNPNDYTFAPGHTIELELVGSTSPFFRKSNGTFRIAVSHVQLRLPTT